MKSLFSSFATVAISACLCACAGTHVGDLPPDASISSEPGIYADSFNLDGSIKTQWWFEYHREAYNKLISEFPQYGLKADDHLTADTPYWKADFTARKQFEELNKIQSMDNFGMTLPKHL